jgi:hypothetical protein
MDLDCIIGNNNGPEFLNQRELSRLQGRFGEGAWVELHGCRVARDLIGRNMLAGLAQLWRVRVLGGESLQEIGRGFEGRVRVATPDGRTHWRSR